MSSKRKDLLFIFNHVRKAVRRGDVAAANRWQKLAVMQSQVDGAAANNAYRDYFDNPSERSRREKILVSYAKMFRDCDARAERAERAEAGYAHPGASQPDLVEDRTVVSPADLLQPATD